MHDAQAQPLGVQRLFDPDLLSLEQEVAARGLIDAGQYLDQRRLPRAVFPDERVHAAAPNLKADLAERPDTGELLR